MYKPAGATSFVEKLVMKNKCFQFIFISIVFLVSSTVSAQNRWMVTIKPAVNFPTSKLATTELKTGYGAEATISYRLLPFISVYSGWGWDHFTVDQPFAGIEADFEETGYVFGFQLRQPAQRWDYIAGAGAIYKHIEVEDENGDLVENSKHGWGWQVSAGISIPLSARLHLSPTLKYQTLSRDLLLNNNASVDLNYLSVAAGIAWSF